MTGGRRPVSGVGRVTGEWRPVGSVGRVTGEWRPVGSVGGDPVFENRPLRTAGAETARSDNQRLDSFDVGSKILGRVP